MHSKLLLQPSNELPTTFQKPTLLKVSHEGSLMSTVNTSSLADGQNSKKSRCTNHESFAANAVKIERVSEATKSEEKEEKDDMNIRRPVCVRPMIPGEVKILLNIGKIRPSLKKVRKNKPSMKSGSRK